MTALVAPESSRPLVRVTTLKDVRWAADLRPLRPGDPRYLDLAPGHGSRAMARVRYNLEVAVDSPLEEEDEGLKIVFTGHRGCGKTTELLRIEKEFADRYYPVHLSLDESLRQDLDYSLMLLWLVHGVADQFQRDGMPLPEALIELVGGWFATCAKVDIERLKATASASGSVSVGGGVGLLGLGLRALAQIKSEALGSLERRQEIRHTLQRYAGDLIDKVNLLLIEAREVLRRNGRPPRLLIVQDNLDRLHRDAARSLFIDTGDILKRLRAHFVFTAPVSLTLAPASINTVFARTFNLPMMKVAGKKGQDYQPGLDTLGALVEQRVDVGLFQPADLVATLCRASGGSVRDLMRLLLRAAEHAAISGLTHIDRASVDRAIADTRVEFQGLLRPESYYFPRLAAIHQTKGDGCLSDHVPDGAKAEDDRRCLAELLLNGSVLEYNGDDSWFDVHPVVRMLKAFTQAQARADQPEA